MSKLIWDASGEKNFETGIEQFALFPISAAGKYDHGVAWNGVTSVTESPSGGEATKLYADNINYATLYSAEAFGGTIEAYTYPDEFAECDGSAEMLTGITVGMQERSTFGFAYKTLMGNDTQGTKRGYKLHLVYGAKASPSEKNYQTVNDSPDAISFSWEFTTTPVPVSGKKPTAIITIDSTKVSAAALAAIEDAIYGSTSKDAYLPLPDELTTLVQTADASPAQG